MCGDKMMADGNVKRTMSCPFVEGGLTLAPDGLYCCSIPLNGVAGWARLCEYTGGPLPIAEIMAAREQHRTEITQDASLSCKGCSAFLSEQDWRVLNRYLFNNLNIEHYTVCNLRCNYCCWKTTHPTEFGQIAYPLWPILKEILANDWMDPNGVVFWGGGEPALLKEFPACLDLMMERGIAHEVSSNATVFSDAIFRHLSNPKFMLTTSVDAGTASTYMKLKEQDRFEDVWRNLQMYAETGGRINVKYIMTDDNCDYAEWMPFVERVASAGLGGSVCLDISHGDPTIKPPIYDELVQMEAACLEHGFGVSCGAHGAHSMPVLNLKAELDARRQAWLADVH
jgi:pyruvate-formate lyase-activating enzyme